MKKKIAVTVISILCIAAAIIAYYLYRMWPILSTTMGRVEQTEEHQSHMVSEGNYSDMGGDQDPFLECMAEAGKSVQASVDLIYAAEDGASLVQRMESRNAEHVLQHGEEIGIGNRSYDLISIDE